MKTLFYMLVSISSFFWLSFFGLAFFCVYSCANGATTKDVSGFIILDFFALLISLMSLLIVYGHAKEL